MSKRARPKYLTPQEIKELMENPESEIFADSDSECDEDDEINTSFLDESEKDVTAPSVQVTINDDQLKVDRAQEIIWSPPSGSENIKKLDFTGTPGLRKQSPMSSNFKEIDFFHLFFSRDLFEELVLQTNTYANQLEELKNEISNNSHTAKWSNTTVDELRKFLAATMLMGHIDKDNILEYWVSR